MSDFHPGESFQNGLSSMFDYVAQIIGALILLVVGYFIAKILQGAVQRLLRKARFDRAMHTSPAGNFIAQVVESPANLTAKIVFWIVFLAFISFAISALDLQVLNQIVGGIYSYLPRVIAAILIFLVASAISAGASGFVLRVMGRTPMAKLVTTVIPSIVMSIAVFMILNQLAIAKDIVNITYTAIIGALALGLALAFGLGGRDVAKQMLEQAYDAGRRNSEVVRDEVSRAKTNAKREASRAADSMS